MTRALVLALLLAACGAPETRDPPVPPSDLGPLPQSPDAGSGAAGSGGAAMVPALPSDGASSAKCTRWTGAPPAGSTLLVIGQDTLEIESYLVAFGVPAGVMTYTNVADLAGFSEEVDFGTGRQSLKHWTGHTAPLAIQLGVSLMKPVDGNPCGGDHAQSIVDRALDGAITSMAIELAVTGRPVLLRFGYEFDNGSCRSYEPSAYRAAFRHFAEVLRTLGAVNVKLVWNAWGGPPANVDAWYPGDDVVDYVGVSVFPAGQLDEKLEAMASFAAAHGKPLMIAEAAPQALHPPSDPASWEAWFAGVFGYIERHDVRVFSYINQDWDAQSVWAAQGIWGDSRLQGSALEGRWRAAVSAERFIHSSAALYGAIGCSE